MQIPNNLIKKNKNLEVIYLKRKLCILLLFIKFALLFGNEADTTLLNYLKSNSMENRRVSLVKLHKMGKQIIPKLINAIDDTSITLLLLTNPIVSSAKEGTIENYAGILYAYLIELILGREHIYRTDSIPADKEFLLGVNLENYIYSYGHIFKKDNTNLSKNDLKKIKKIYKIWWNNNKNLSICQLRCEWGKGNRPLIGSEYDWK